MAAARLLAAESAPPADAAEPERYGADQDHLDHRQRGLGVAAAVEAVDHDPKRKGDQERDQRDAGNQPDQEGAAWMEGRLVSVAPIGFRTRLEVDYSLESFQPVCFQKKRPLAPSLSTCISWNGS